jgi:hypothetical protein
MADYIRDLRPAKWGSMINLRCKSRRASMSSRRCGDIQAVQFSFFLADQDLEIRERPTRSGNSTTDRHCATVSSPSGSV